MRRLSGVGVLLWCALVASPASGQLTLLGGDSFEQAVLDIVSDCENPLFNPGTLLPPGSISYVGAGSSVSQATMLASPPTQHMTPMSRALSGATACPGGTETTPGTLDARGQQLLIALDGIVVLHANPAHLGGDLSTDVGTFQCPDAILPGDAPLTINVPGCNATDGCNASGNYTFNSWKEVLAMLYGGQNHLSAQSQLLPNSAHCSVTIAQTCATDGDCPPPEEFGPIETCVYAGRRRNPARINCASPVRKFLADNWGALFANGSTANCGYGAPPAGSTQSQCLKLKHAFRLGDTSGTTELFASLTGLIPIPAFSTKINGTGPNNCQEAFDGANATTNPFCNAGPDPMNKGWADYRDLDPIRRIADSTNAPRTGLEQVAEGGIAPVNIPPVRGNDNRADPTLIPVELPEHGGSQSNWGPDLSTTQAAFLANEDADLALRKGLGLVLPIEIPGNYRIFGDSTYWDASNDPGVTPVLCDLGVVAGSIITAPKLGQFPACPGGAGSGNCLLPVHKDPFNGALNFNCLSDTPVPAKVPLKDERYFNTAVFNTAGKLVKDNFCNPNLTAAPLNCSCAGQARPVSAWFRLHVNRATDLGGVNLRGPVNPSTNVNGGFPTANGCVNHGSAYQLGCLVAANPCSVGFGGRSAVDQVAFQPVNNFAYQLGGDPGGIVGSLTSTGSTLPATNNHVLALLDPLATDVYPMARRIFVSRWVDPANAETSMTNFSNEETLFQCFANDSITTPEITLDNLVAIPGGPRIDNLCPNNR